MFREYVEEVEKSESKMVILPRNTAFQDEEREREGERGMEDDDEREVKENEEVEEMKGGEEEEDEEYQPEGTLLHNH